MNASSISSETKDKNSLDLNDDQIKLSSIVARKMRRFI